MAPHLSVWTLLRRGPARSGSILDRPTAPPPQRWLPQTKATASPPRSVPRWQRFLQRDETAEHLDTSDVSLSGWVRLRSTLLLALTVVGLAALLGVVASVLVVGLGLLVT